MTMLLHFRSGSHDSGPADYASLTGVSQHSSLARCDGECYAAAGFVPVNFFINSREVENG